MLQRAWVFRGYLQLELELVLVNREWGKELKAFVQVPIYCELNFFLLTVTELKRNKCRSVYSDV